MGVIWYFSQGFSQRLVVYLVRYLFEVDKGKLIIVDV